ncbi:refilin-A [Octodon degus]|uniref:Refilin-A n=1 Tax=Octodon degus TaxID=10160 RepID=A0A6P6EVN4_OCTDE|nr:refilin-A [Octodon degus]
MVGHLHLQGMGGLKERSREGQLDSPDSGLPPSPSPPFDAQAPGILDSAQVGGPGAASEPPGLGPTEDRTPHLPCRNASLPEMRPRMLPVVFGETIEVDPEPPHEIRCNSELKYASERHFRDKVFYAPVPTVTGYSETIVAAPNCTWRSFRSQLTLEPRPRALLFRCTTIIFPKRARSSFRTTVHCSLGRPRRSFTASVQLRLCGAPTTL